MNDAVIMRELQRITNLRQQRERHLLRHLATADDVHQIRAIHQLHDDVEVVRSGLTEINDADDVRVAELGHGLRLALKAGLEIVVPAQLTLHDLDRHRALQTDLLTFVHRPHAALAQETFHVVTRPPQQRAQLLRQGQIWLFTTRGVRLGGREPDRHV